MYLKLYKIKDTRFKLNQIKILRFSINPIYNSNKGNVYYNDTSKFNKHSTDKSLYIFNNNVLHIFNKCIDYLIWLEKYNCYNSSIPAWRDIKYENNYEYIIIYNIKSSKILGWATLKYEKDINNYINIKLLYLQTFLLNPKIYNDKYPKYIGELIINFIINKCLNEKNYIFDKIYKLKKIEILFLYSNITTLPFLNKINDTIKNNSVEQQYYILNKNTNIKEIMIEKENNIDISSMYEWENIKTKNINYENYKVNKECYENITKIK